MRTSLLVLLVLLVAGCGRSIGLRPIDKPPVTVIGISADAGTVDAGIAALVSCSLPFGGPDCCGSTNARVGSASCSDGGYVCEAGALCACQGAPAAFHCVDVCGGDAYTGAVCTLAGWACPQGLIKTSDCPAGTCFGEPGDCCIGAQCNLGAWTCQALRSPCN